MAISTKTKLCIAAVVIGTGLAISLRAGLFTPAPQADAPAPASQDAAYGPAKAGNGDGKACCEKPPSRAALFNAAK